MRPCALIVCAVAACHSGGAPLTGFVATESGEGPRVVWDLNARPLPEIPFPNDIATRPDPTSPTGLRLNAALDAPTQQERQLREKLDSLDGFGTFGPLWVRFDRPLDVRVIAARQRGDTHFEDDVVLLINVTHKSPHFGDAVVLDFANGSFPITLDRSYGIFDGDVHAADSNVLFEVRDEDTDGDGVFDHYEDSNQNGVLDPGEDKDGDGKLDPEEDTDGDGVFDKPNLFGQLAGDPTRMHPFADLLTYYERETNTLIFRPVVPLEEETTYAVVLLKDLVDPSGNFVRSPFAYVHHLQQRSALAPLFEEGLLAKYGRHPEDVAFAWTFTTQSITRPMVALRDGLNGEGPFAKLADAYPPEVTSLAPLTERNGVQAYLLEPADIVAAVQLVFDNLQIGEFDSSRVNSLIDTYGAVDYVVAGDYTSADLLAAGNGVFDLDLHTGRVSHQPASLRFLLVVPKPTYGKAPFPVALYCHGYRSMKLEALAFAGVLAKFGIATFVIDAYHHGLPVGGEFQPLIDSLLDALDGKGLKPFFRAIAKDRAVDLNGDSIPDPGGDFWTTDVFHTRDLVRQTVLDYLQALRVLRAFDGTTRWPIDVDGDGLPELAGDFNADGQVDVGGPTVPYFAMGSSMGAILATVLGTLDESIVAAATLSPGGGLAEIGQRTSLSAVRIAALLPMLGPLVTLAPVQGDPRLVNASWQVDDIFTRRTVPFARIGVLDGTTVTGAVRPGDRLVVENLKNGERDEVRVTPERTAIAHLPADVGDPVRLQVLRPNGELVREVTSFEYDVDNFQGRHYMRGTPLVAIQNGLGLHRNSPELRRFFALAQTILDPADAVNFAPRYREPPSSKGRRPAVGAAVYVTIGDSTVPAGTGVAIGRAAGIIDHSSVDPRYGVSQNQLLADTHVIEAVEHLRYFAEDPCHYDSREVNFDIDDLSRGHHPDHPPRLAEIVENPECSLSTPPPFCAVTCVEKPPLRATVHAGNAVLATRFVALNLRGQHVIDLPDPSAVFDASMFVLNQIGLFFAYGGTSISDHPCLAKNDCQSCAGEPDCPALPPAPTLDVALQ